MWKFLICVVSVLISANTLFAQLLSKPSFSRTDDIEFGVKTGLNLATTKFPSQSLDINRIRLFNAGFFVQVNLDKKFSIRPEFLFAVKGFGYSELNRYQRKVKFNYLTMPLLAGYRVTKELTVFAGPEFGYLLDAVVTGDNLPNRTNVTKLYREIDFALDIGSLLLFY